MTVASLILLVAAVPFAQQTEPAKDSGLAPELLLLARAKTHAQETLQKQPNYTCLETVERSERLLPAKRFRLVDTLRLEVALVDGKELFAWPGAKKFEKSDPRDIITHGAFGNGNFASFAKAVFQTSAPTFTFRGNESAGGRSAARWDFRVPQMRSGYRLRVGERSGVAGYRGSFWVDSKSLDLIRLEVEGEDIPPDLDLARVHDRMDYARQRIGDSDFLLPASSELLMADLRGNEHRNRITFSACRQYVGESVLRFDEAPEPAAPAVVAPRTVTIPPGANLIAYLESAIDFGKSAIGDTVYAKVANNAKIKGQILVPKDARISGTIVAMSSRMGRREVEVVFDTVAWPGVEAAFVARFDEAMTPKFPGSLVTVKAGSRISAVVLANGGAPVIARGTGMWWTTAADGGR